MEFIKQSEVEYNQGGYMVTVSDNAITIYKSSAVYTTDSLFSIFGTSKPNKNSPFSKVFWLGGYATFGINDNRLLDILHEIKFENMRWFLSNTIKTLRNGASGSRLHAPEQYFLLRVKNLLSLHTARAKLCNKLLGSKVATGGRIFVDHPWKEFHYTWVEKDKYSRFRLTIKDVRGDVDIEDEKIDIWFVKLYGSWRLIGVWDVLPYTDKEDFIERRNWCLKELPVADLIHEYFEKEKVNFAIPETASYNDTVRHDEQKITDWLLSEIRDYKGGSNK